MVKFSRVAVVVVATLAASQVGAHTAQARPSADDLTYQQIAALPLAQQAAILDPLWAVASAAAAVGISQFADIYSGLQIDAPAHIVTIYLTDLSRQAEFLAAAGRADSTPDLTLARFARGGHTRAALTAARDALMLQKNPTVESVAIPADGSALRVRARNVEQARQAFARPNAAGSVPVVVAAAQGLRDLSRLRDSPSWIAGAAITQTSDSQSIGWTCTTGLPARRNSDGRSFVITAAHCYGNGVTVYTGWESGGRNRIGVVTNRNNLHDAIAVDTSSTGQTLSLEWDGLRPGPYQVLDVSGSAFSFNGDMTCQDGYSSGIVCGLRVIDDNFQWTGGNGVAHQGVQAQQVNGLRAGRGGDSGGLVFACLNNCSTRRARGIVSGGDTGTIINWTESPFILTAFGMSLAP